MHISLSLKRIKQLASLTVLTFAFLTASFALSAPARVAALSSPPQFLTADSVSDAKDGIGLTGKDKGGTSISSVIKTLINILSAIVGVAAVIMIIVSGMKYITSGGDANSVAGAKNTLVYAIVGLVIVAFAQIIVHFVIGAATK